MTKFLWPTHIAWINILFLLGLAVYAAVVLGIPTWLVADWIRDESAAGQTAATEPAGI